MSVHLTDNSVTQDGLTAMLTSLLGVHGYLDGRVVEEPIALFIIELAKHAPDTEEFFPLGKWATIQALEERTHRAICSLLKEPRP